MQAQIAERAARAAGRRRRITWLRAKTITSVLRLLLALFLAAIMALPFIWMVCTSFKPIEETIRIPPTFLPEHSAGLDNYLHVLQAIPFGHFILNSITVSVTVTAGALFTSALAGYIFAKFQFKGRDVLFFLVISSIIVPFQVILVPVYLIVRSLGLYDTLWALIIPSLVTAWGIFLMRQSMKSIPTELIDAARIDGASEMGIFLRIILPISVPTLAALGIFIFMASWNDFLWPLIVISNVNNRTLPLGLATFSSGFGISRWNVVMAADVLGILPIIIVFFLLQHYFIDGITMGAVKG